MPTAHILGDWASPHASGCVSVCRCVACHRCVHAISVSMSSLCSCHPCVHGIPVSLPSYAISVSMPHEHTRMERVCTRAWREEGRRARCVIVNGKTQLDATGLGPRGRRVRHCPPGSVSQDPIARGPSDHEHLGQSPAFSPLSPPLTLFT